jgi:hypothetical protein
MQVDPRVRPAVAHHADHRGSTRVGPAHRVGELDQLDVDVMVAGDAHHPVDEPDDVLGRDVARKVAAERRPSR